MLLLPGDGTVSPGTDMPQSFVLLLQVQAHAKQRANSVEEWPGTLCEHCRCHTHWDIPASVHIRCHEWSHVEPEALVRDTPAMVKRLSTCLFRNVLEMDHVE